MARTVVRRDQEVPLTTYQSLRQPRRAEEAAVRKILKGLSCRDYRRLAAVAGTEPPRVRAILGALGEQLGRPTRELDRLRASLNPSSRFDFGMFTDLPNARAWQAKERR